MKRLRKHLPRFVLFVFVAWLLFVVAFGTAIHFYGQTERPLSSADAIFVLGPAWERRVNHAADLWFQVLAPVLVCSGGKEPGELLTQAEICRDLLIACGIPAEMIVLEDVSISTEENALYARELINERDWQTVIVVSDDYHLLRVDWLFRRSGIIAEVSPVSTHAWAFGDYLYALAREIIAFHWQVLIDLLNLPVTHVVGV